MLSGILLAVVAPVKLASIFPELEKAEFVRGRLIKAFSSGVDLSGNDSNILQIYSTWKRRTKRRLNTFIATHFEPKVLNILIKILFSLSSSLKLI
jgi:hypothetical protein